MRRNIKMPDLFSTKDIARLLEVDYTTVIEWCKKEKLSSFKTPGGHRRVHFSDLMIFLEKFNLPVPPSLSAIGGLNCVVVDDDPDIRKIVTRLIRQIDKNAKIEEAPDGFAAGQKIMEILPNLVILDLNLPGMNGFSVCERIRQDPRFKTTKILAITGQDTPENKKRILLAGADDFLPKPFEIKTLKETILKLLK